MRIPSATLTNNTECAFGDFNVFIGGNGVGKTTLLLELHAKATGVTRSRFHWVATTGHSSADIAEDMKLLKSSFARKYEGANLFYYSRAARDSNGSVDLTNEMRFTDHESSRLEEQSLSIFDQPKYRRPFVALSSCDARLGLPDVVELSSLSDPPQDPINVLYRNREILEQIDNTLKDRFQINFILLDHTKRQLNLGVSRATAPAFDNNAKNLQEEYAKIDSWQRQNFTVLSESGHGIRSMIRLLTTMFEPVNTVIMIDEPEVHLYPSQKRWLGKQLVELAKTSKKQVFLVTHDPIVLQGILDANTTTNVFRLERAGGEGTVKSCELSQFKDVTATRNQEQYLQGLFYQRCIVVEGATDRSLYQNLLEDFPEVRDKDIGFVVSGGKASSKHMAVIGSKVGLSCAFIFDLDAIIWQTSIVKETFTTRGGIGDPLNALEQVFESDDAVKKATDEKQRYAAIKALTGYTEKAGFSQSWRESNANLISRLMDSLATVGIFIVPCGTLESWAPTVEPKVRFAELAPEVIRSDAALLSQLKEFLGRVLHYFGIASHPDSVALPTVV